MENVILSGEQFERLIEAIKPGQLIEPPKVDVEMRDRSLALDVLRSCETCSWGGASEFCNALRELAKTKI